MNALPRVQFGAALPVALIFLVLLALLAISASQDTTLQERMAGNTRNTDLAFEAADAALQYAKNTLTTWRTQSFGNIYPYKTYDPRADNDAAYWSNPSIWNNGNYNALQLSGTNNTLSQVASQPQYLIDKMPSCVLGTNTEYYRVTARGVGGESNAVVVLQAIYSFAPPPGGCIPITP